MNDKEQDDVGEHHPWQCERCTISNHYSRSSCHACWRVRGSELWECPSCHFYNFPSKRSCGVCRTPDPQIKIAKIIADESPKKRSPLTCFDPPLTISVCVSHRPGNSSILRLSQKAKPWRAGTRIGGAPPARAGHLLGHQ
jgi:hypothetical protein